MRKLEKIVGAGKNVETRAARLSIRRWGNQRRIDQSFLQGRETGTVKAEGDNLDILVGVDAGMLQHHAGNNVVGAAVNAYAESSSCEGFDGLELGTLR